MQYSHFGKVPVTCQSCRSLTLGRVGVGVSPHFLAVVCDRCGEHSSQWITTPDLGEKPNPLVDDAEPIKWGKHKPTIQAPSLFEDQ